jgi:hypothetical protein
MSVCDTKAFSKEIFKEGAAGKSMDALKESVSLTEKVRASG